LGREAGDLRVREEAMEVYSAGHGVGELEGEDIDGAMVGGGEAQILREEIGILLE